MSCVLLLLYSRKIIHRIVKIIEMNRCDSLDSPTFMFVSRWVSIKWLAVDLRSASVLLLVYSSKPVHRIVKILGMEPLRTTSFMTSVVVSYWVSTECLAC